MRTKGDLKEDLAPFVDDIKIMAKLPDGTICDIGEGHYRWDRDYDEAVWILDLTPRAKRFASSSQETSSARWTDEQVEAVERGAEELGKRMICGFCRLVPCICVSAPNR